jgi:hypothetical protein
MRLVPIFWHWKSVEKYWSQKDTSPTKTFVTGTNTVTYVKFFPKIVILVFHIFHYVHYDSIVTMHTLR